MEESKREAKKEEGKGENKIQKFFKNKTNVWMSVSIVLAIALIAVLVLPRGLTGNVAGDRLVNFLNTEVVPDGGVTLKSIVDQGNLYEVTVVYNEQDIPVFITKDGKYFIQGATEINPSDVAKIPTNTPTQTPTEVPKSAKPKVEAFVFSYCPYGLQFEKALSPVYDLLKNKADINIVFIGAMHGEYEKIESLRQLCIQKNYGKDKLWAYLNKFNIDAQIDSCGSDSSCSKPLTEAIMKTLSVDATKINTCMTNDAPALYESDESRAAELGVSGSPTFVINDVEVSVSRDAESIKTAICNAFTDDSKPSECSKTLSTDSATPGFGSGTGGSSSASC